MILVDTNLLARMINSAHAQCAIARHATTVLRERGERLFIVPQNLYEFYAVATRKAGAPPTGQNGLGMTPNQAGLWLKYFQRRFMLLADREDMLSYWHELVVANSIKGLRSYDARLVAAMKAH